MGSSWKTVRVFISSTFRDMQAERDHLVKVTFPRLRQWCAERRLHLVDIDLRWGVTREEAESGKALEICLGGVDDSRPFFVCLLGSRYGWVPEVAPPEEKYCHRSVAGAAGLSVTHLEILHAVLEPLPRKDGSTPPRCEQAFFYFRDAACLPEPAALVHLPQDQQTIYRRVYFEQEPGCRQRLETLKETLRERFAGEGRVTSYGGTWDWSALPLSPSEPEGRLTGLDEFGERVEADLRRGITEQFAAHLAALGTAADPFEEERALHEAFLEGRIQSHVPRRTVEESLSRYVQGADPRPLVLSGQPGSGKSAVLAHWVDAQKDRTAAKAGAAVVVTRFVGASPASTRLSGVLGSICEELRRRLDLQETTGDVASEPHPMWVPADPNEVMRKWPAFLAAAVAKARIIIVIDGLNQLEGGLRGWGTHWIPARLPSGLRLVISVLDSGAEGRSEDLLQVLRARGIPELPVPDLTDDDRRELIRTLPSIYGKSLDENQIRLLLGNPATRNPLFLSVALQELRVFGSFERLTDAVAQLPQPIIAQEDASRRVPFESALLALWGQVLDRLDEETARLTPGLVPQMFALIASSRDGLSESELEALLVRAFPRWDPAIRTGNLQAALRQVRSYLQRKQAQGSVLLGFFHESLSRAVRAKYLPSEESRASLHVEIAAFFESQDYRLAVAGGSGGLPAVNVRKVVELPWQRLEAAKLAARNNPASPHWQAVSDLLTDWRFLEAKSEAPPL